MCCSVLQRVAMCCSVLRCVAVGERGGKISENLSREKSAKFKQVRDDAVRCSALRSVAVVKIERVISKDLSK